MELNELRKIAEQATPGPWETLGGQGPFGTHAVCHRMEQGTLVEIAYRDAHFDKANAVHIATFDPPTVLALLNRLEQAEQDRDNLKNRLDAMRRQRDGYRNQLRKTEQQVARVRAMTQDWDANGNACALGDHSADVWHATANAIRIELDRMARTNQGENNA